MIIAGLVIYAYGFQVTQVSLDKTREPRRQTQFVRIIRALFRPDILEYEREEVQVNAPILVPCPAGSVDFPEPDKSGPYMVITPECAPPRSEIQAEGFNFAPNSRGPLNFIPPSQVTLQLGRFETDEDGYFIANVRLPNRQPTEEVQHIRTITRTNVGLPHFTRTAHDTWAKIIETVFMALLATTLGTALAVPVSFLAARNIMKDVTSPVSSVALSLIAWPAGIWLGMSVARWAGNFSQMITTSTALSMAGLAAGPLFLWGTVRWAMPQVEARPPGRRMRIARLLALALAALVGVIALFLVADIAARVGRSLAGPLGSFGFIGTFIVNLGDILNAIIVITAALAAGMVLSNSAGKLGQFLTESLPAPNLKVINLLLAALAGATLAALLGGMVEWLYEMNRPALTILTPAAFGALAGLAIAVRIPSKESLSIGFAIYYVSRTILNTLRSIEAFIMAIVFVVLVSTGPFAGVMALSLHTVAALAKLYSEQVESILPGPLEAVRATGATRLQTIIYAVIPQIIPPYISFTMYRWDINVRMSTIIGFAGGGGIGFLLQQNINLLNYRAASVQIIAIAIVVGLMDYISSRMREQVV